MELTNLKSEAKYSSRYLVEQINLFRQEEGGRANLRHSDFLSKIESEFNEEITERKISPSQYKDNSGKFNKMYELNFEQSLQMLMSESKTVRNRCIEVMKEQQAKIESLTPKVPKTYLEALKDLVVKEEENQILLSKNIEQERILEEQKPKVEFYDDVANTSSSFDMQEVSAMLKLNYGRNRLFEKLRESKVLMKDNLPYRTYIDNGYFVVVETKWNNSKSGQVNATYKSMVTQKGLEWLNRSKDKLKL